MHTRGCTYTHASTDNYRPKHYDRVRCAVVQCACTTNLMSAGVEMVNDTAMHNATDSGTSGIQNSTTSSVRQRIGSRFHVRKKAGAYQDGHLHVDVPRPRSPARKNSYTTFGDTGCQLLKFKLQRRRTRTQSKETLRQEFRRLVRPTGDSPARRPSAHVGAPARLIVE
jgi:hypothetical protein